MPDHASVLARIGYDANRAYALSLGERMPPWEEAEAVDREIWQRAARVHLASPTASPDYHQRAWLALEAEAGWGYGPDLDNAAKRHPHHVPWDRLPAAQRVKVMLFRAIAQEYLLWAVPANP